jgi:NAD(P)-dependent dehydrogenase (short-subunit alcohol dehydrogenase family)
MTVADIRSDAPIPRWLTGQKAPVPGASHAIAYAHRDVSDEGQVRTVLSAVVQRLGTIDILVNKAGLQRDGMTLFPRFATSG